MVISKISLKSALIIVQQLILIAIVVLQLYYNQYGGESHRSDETISSSSKVQSSKDVLSFATEVKNFEEVGKNTPVHIRMPQLVSRPLFRIANLFLADSKGTQYRLSKLFGWVPSPMARIHYYWHAKVWYGSPKGVSQIESLSVLL